MRQELIHHLIKRTGVPFTGCALVPFVHPTGTPATFIPVSNGFVRVDWNSAPSVANVDLVFSAIQNGDQNERTPNDANEEALNQSLSDFRTMPNYATWTPSEAETNITNAVMSGKTLAQVNADIDALANSVAGVKLGLKAMAAAIIDLRSVLAIVGKMIMLLRNVAIRKG